jgi:outer membrane biogenesis lipoprotein LolB
MTVGGPSNLCSQDRLFRSAQPGQAAWRSTGSSGYCSDGERRVARMRWSYVSVWHSG